MNEFMHSKRRVVKIAPIGKWAGDMKTVQCWEDQVRLLKKEE